MHHHPQHPTKVTVPSTIKAVGARGQPLTIPVQAATAVHASDQDTPCCGSERPQTQLSSETRVACHMEHPVQALVQDTSSRCQQQSKSQFLTQCFQEGCNPLQQPNPCRRTHSSNTQQPTDDRSHQSDHRIKHLSTCRPTRHRGVAPSRAVLRCHTCESVACAYASLSREHTAGLKPCDQRPTNPKAKGLKPCDQRPTNPEAKESRGQ